MSRLGQTSTVKQAFCDLAALVARVGVGGIFFANGWTKLEDGLKITGAKFLEQGAPAPGAWATVTMLAELIGGALLIAGLAVSVTGLILFAEALAVFLVAPPLNPITMNELILLGAASLLLAVVGAGRVSVDHMVVIRRRESAAADEFAAETEADQVIASLREPDEPAGAPAAKEASPAAGEEPAAPGEAPPAPAGEDTAPHPRPPRARGGEPPRTEERTPAEGDTLVAGRKKPPARNRRPATD
ncbi:DoxX family protein [Nonomuraea jiangxiensis]|uniref:Putative oxidoreductase n=1 Tax=Nonomuraea jiangxiensis TaxID=633440 RepID=A0A1G9E9R6_9ACTN|nr:DoxX family protein [Nonomuraea jiangxiensis]SDK72844.1 putative oxidoreductase [Nonomuraea jiangxiensis]